ncbi:MAG: hypothetical protein CM15mV84_180 [uncultured marine virus]|nr:MAG: hypothetical protein CM15mV84_180 [uncultured marine virus]
MMVQGPTTNLYNVWGFCPDGPARGSNLNLHFGGYSGSGSRPNIHTPTLNKFVFTSGGNFNPPSNGTGSLGTDGVRWGSINTNKIRIDVSSGSGTGSGSVEGIFLRNTNETDGNAVAIFGGADDYSNAGSAINFVNVDHSANVGQIQFDTRSASGYAGRVQITSDGHLKPVTDGVYDLGGTSQRWRNIYTNDLHLSNKGHTNDVDGSWGDWTIQEGESDLFLKNNRSGKKYKFNLTEVS